MAIETLDDIIDQLANWVGVYGAHDDAADWRKPDALHCRVCFTSIMSERITAAVNVEAIMRRVTFVPYAAAPSEGET